MPNGGWQALSRRRVIRACGLALLVGGLSVAGAAAPAPAVLSAAELDTAERRLAELGYWTGPLDGRIDPVSRRGLLAFQRVAGRAPTGRLTRDEFEALRLAVPVVPLEPVGPHVEVDLARQILFLVDAEGRARQIVTISSGSGRPFYHRRWGRGDAVTPCGRFSVYRKLSGWHRSPLGAMHNPMFVVGGIAIHGSADVPLRPARGRLGWKTQRVDLVDVGHQDVNRAAVRRGELQGLPRSPRVVAALEAVRRMP